jgi:iron complex outermembrane receptor protein
MVHPEGLLMRLLFSFSCLLGCGLAIADTNVNSGPVQQHSLQEIVVKGQIINAEKTSYSATTLNQQDIREHSYSNTDELFKLVPGMAVRDLQLGGVANSIVIRGFGGGGHGGDLGAVIDGIPLNEAMSHADGYVDLNVLIPLETESFTVFKGPVSALYGNFNRGGLVNIQTRKSGNYAETDFTLGENELVDLQGAIGQAIGENQQFNAAAQYYQNEGYRPQSETERKTVSARWAIDATESLDIALSSRLHKAEADSASYLTYEQFKKDPYGIDPNVQNDGSEKNFATVRVDANYTISDHLKLLTFVYGTDQDFTRWFTRPVSATTWRQREETYDRSVFGAGTSLNGEQNIASVAVTYVAGVEGFHESTDYKFFDDLNYRERINPAGSDRETELNSASAFAEVEADFDPLAQLSFGLRADSFTGGCNKRGPETGSDPCYSLNKTEHISPKLGLRSLINDHLQLRASWSEGFALPNGFIKYSEGGQPLNENVFRQTEIGLHAIAGTLDFDIAAYRLTSTDEVRTVSPGIYENFGETLRRGVETTASWKPVEEFELRAIYGWTDTDIAKNANPAMEGLEVAGVPKNSTTLEMNIIPVQNWTINVAWRDVGAYQIDALNTLKADSYNTTDLNVAYTGKSPTPYRIYARIENITDREYATTESVIGSQHLVAPGAPRLFRTGIQLNF